MRKTIYILLVPINILLGCDSLRSGFTAYEKVDSDQSGMAEVHKKIVDGDEHYSIYAFYSSYQYGAGRDKEYLTNDDRVVRYEKVVESPENVRFAYDEEAVITKSYVVNNPGLDGKWFTEDDGTSSYDGYWYYPSEILYTVESDDGETFRKIRYFAPCSPNNCGINNSVTVLAVDNIFGYTQTKVVELADGVEKTNSSFGSPGADGLWFTEDDELQNGGYYESGQSELVQSMLDEHSNSYDSFYYGAVYTRVIEYDDGRVESTTFRSSGEDKLWFSEDDEVAYSTTNSSAVEVEDGVFEYAEEFEGTDQIGVNRNVRKIRKNSNGDILRVVNYRSAGIDNIWLTDDDTIESIIERKTETISSSEIEHVYTMLTGPGEDGVWLSDDDVISYYVKEVVKDTDKHQTTSTIRGVEVGEDGSWFTDDDILSGLFGTYDAGPYYAPDPYYPPGTFYYDSYGPVGISHRIELK